MSNKAYNQIKQVHIAFGSPVADYPAILEGAGEPVNTYYVTRLGKICEIMKGDSKRFKNNRVLARSSWILEELVEFLAANTLEDQVDALTDLGVFKDGGFVEIGLEPEKFTDAVMEANMGKLWEDGKPRFDEQSKWIKPPGWAENYAPEPKIRAEIERQKKEADAERLATRPCAACGGTELVPIGPGVRGLSKCPYCS